ncbi:uncharacterized protein JN550_011382 [Neoarthrinium moseri]|uniref:uncharacterized protein n=1 Tax=Neoarthrinium moseri TaxID=1658444 RepID=UPI001FDAFF5D|nr:uncharacterized protein JN550_011382 [Neoarthrinium moseri]KAI1860657.1 hypothetical protein JN550_011382 [Neoarthrinium moseri]
MASRSGSRDKLIRSPSSSTSGEFLAQTPRKSISKKRKRDANVYDAVAGRVTTTSALDDGPGLEEAHPRYQRASLRDPTLAPEEVLFRRAGAPVRYAEKDIYFAQEQLPGAGHRTLPDSDMLKAIHHYSSHFYWALATGHNRLGNGGAKSHEIVDEQSMDETALLALGILLEEAGREALGKRGDLVFTEGMPSGDDGQLKSRCDGPFSFLDTLPTPVAERSATTEMEQHG